MPNHFTTILTVQAKGVEHVSDLMAFIRKYTDLDGYAPIAPPNTKHEFSDADRPERETEIRLSTAFRPMPLKYVGTVDGSHSVTADDGLTWYSWAIQNWGTKWGTYDESHMISDDRIVIEMQSAWGPPGELIKFISEAYPNLSFEANGYDEGDDDLYYMSWDNGEYREVNLGVWRGFDEAEEDWFEHCDPSQGLVKEPPSWDKSA